MITERTLRRWRAESLVQTQTLSVLELNITAVMAIELHSRVLRLTQYLIDQYMIRGLYARAQTRQINDRGKEKDSQPVQVDIFAKNKPSF